MNRLPSRTDYDVIVIGGGHNGLVAAAYLARAGKQVAVFEKRGALGGAAGSLEVFPGYLADSGGQDAGLWLPHISADLNLERHGLQWLEPPSVVFAPQLDGSSLTLWRDPQRAQAEIASISSRDADRYPEFIRQVSRFASVLREMMTVAPPALPEVHLGELLPWGRAALKLKQLGDREMMEFLRVLPMPVVDYLDEWFENPALKAAIGASSVIGNFLGPWSPGTAFMLLYQAGQAGFRSSRFVRGGMHSLTQALAAEAAQYGAEIFTGMGVAQVIIEQEKAVGVILSNGMAVKARAVASNADPQATFFGLVGAPNLPLSFVREVKNYRLQASLARVNLALSELPAFSGVSSASDREKLSGHIILSPDLEYVEQAFEDAKYGQFSQRPVLDIVIPTINDPSLAPPGSHLLSINVFYAPTRLQGAGWDEARQSLLGCVVETLSAYSPGLQERIVHSQALTPLDLERDLGLTHGDIYHGQMGLDQLLMMRPAAGYGRYHTPLENLFLCGAGAHPGGGITGAPGFLAAQAILKHIR